MARRPDYPKLPPGGKRGPPTREVDMPEAIAVFFDIGDTLAVPKLTAAGALESLDVFPFVPQILERFRTSAGPGGAPLRLGIISNTGTETVASLKRVLDQAGLLDFFEDELLVFSSAEGVDKSTRAIFDRAQARARIPAQRCLFVGEDEGERTVAASAGFRVSFHALHAFHVVGGIVP